MARIFSVPVEFEFSPIRSKWGAAHARVLGWWEKDGILDTEHLKAEVYDGAMAGRVFSMDLQDLPVDLFDECATADDEADIEAICSDFAVAVLVNTAADQAPVRARDPWQMREEFVRMIPTVDGVIAFLNRWGCWGSRSIQILDDVIKARARLRQDLTLPPDKWLRESPWFLGPMFPKRTYPFRIINTEKCAVGVRMTTLIDFLNGTTFKKCARHDCNNPFEVKSKHGQIFCEWYCGHLESMRRNRVSAKKKTRGKKT